ncbi:MAG: hypothetical protein WD069_09350 [Planctomycetales bacterium]
MKFRYRRYAIMPSLDFPDGALYRPEVPLRVIGLDGSEILSALVDTGADVTLLPRSTQNAIGGSIDEAATSRIAGIGGREIEVMSGDVTLALECAGETLEWIARVRFIPDESSSDAGAILGHAGCLQFFRATFDGHAQDIELLPAPDFPGSLKRE